MEVQPRDRSSERADQFARAVLVGLLCAVPAFLCLRGAGECVADPDVGWHLQAGTWILQHHGFPRVDPFSRASEGTPWQAYSWLFELVLLKLYGWMNLKGLVVFTAGLMTLIGVAVYHMMSRLQANFTQRALLATAVMGVLAKMGTPRPWLITILLFAVEMDILMRSRRDGRSRELLWLPPLFALWANVHIQFIDGLLFLGAAACEPVLARWWKSDAHPASARNLWMILAACVAATCLNPYGPGIYRIAWQLASQPGVLNSVTEMQALPFRTTGDFLLLFLALGAAGVLFRYRRLAPFETLMLAMAAVLSFRSRRDLWVLAITAGAILAAGLPARDDKTEHRGMRVWALATSAAVLVAVLAASMVLLHVNNQRLQAELAKKMPVQAVAAIRERHYTGALFNDYNWGGFLIWKLQEPVSMDGRAALYGDKRMERSRRTWAGAPNWATDPELESAGLVIGPRDAALTQLLRTDSHFALVYEDKVAAVFVAENGGKTGGSAVAVLASSQNSSSAKLP